MAETQSLFNEVGLGISEEEKAARLRQTDSNDAASGGVLLGGIGGAIGSLFGKNKDRTIREGFAAGTQRQQDMQAAQATGRSVSALEARRRSRKAAEGINIEPTDDAIADQQEALKQLAEVANRENDTELLLNINRKRLALRVQQEELQKAELGNEGKVTENAQSNQDFGKDKYTGIDIIPPGANPRDPNFVPDSAIYNADTRQWTVLHRDGTEEVLPEGAQVQSYDPQLYGAKSGKVSDTPLSIAIKRSGTGKAFAAKGEQLLNLQKIASTTGSVVDLFTSMNDPQSITAWFGKTAVVGDKAIRFGESAARLAKGESGDSTYITDSGKTFRNDQYVVNGKAVSRDQQVKWASAKIEEGIEALGGIEKLFPQIKQTSAAASKYKAMIMELAYMDARMQEPSNRGLSDKDIEAALERIGAFSANPTVFIDRQIQLANRNLGELDQLGIEYADTENSRGEIVTKQQLIDVTYNQEFVSKVRRSLMENVQKLTDARAQIEARLTGVVPPVDPFEGKTTAEIQAELDALPPEVQ